MSRIVLRIGLLNRPILVDDGDGDMTSVMCAGGLFSHLHQCSRTNLCRNRSCAAKQARYRPWKSVLRSAPSKSASIASVEAAARDAGGGGACRCRRAGRRRTW
jgi:hypothetical protein